jgi:hypothetical protein
LGGGSGWRTGSGLGGGGAVFIAAGGGGYSGGGGGPEGGGVGFFNAGLDQILMADVRSGDGEVVITFVFAGTPGAANCHGQSVSALARQGGINSVAAALGYASVQALQDAISAYALMFPADS